MCEETPPIQAFTMWAPKEPVKNKLSFSLVQLQAIFAWFEISKILEIVHYYCGCLNFKPYKSDLNLDA